MIRKLLLALVLLVLLVAGALIAAVVLIDPNDYKDEISELAREHTGRELRIVDDMRLSVFPWLGVELGQTILSNAEGFGPEPFARADSARVKVRLLPLLLERRIEVDTITVEGLALRLETDASGRTNWEDLGGDADGEAPARDDRDPGEVAVALPAALTIGGLELRGASLYWRDAAAGSEIAIEGLDLTSGKIETDRPVTLELSFDLRSADPAVRGRIELSTWLEARFADERYSIDDLRLRARLAGEPVPGGEANLALNGRIVADMGQDTVEVPAFDLTAAGIRLDGSARVAGLSSEPRLSGRVAVAEFNPRRVLGELGAEAPETTDPAVLTRASLALQFEGTTKDARIDSLDLRLDDTRARGKAAVRDFDDPAITFELAVDAIDVDRYLSPADETPAGSAPAAPAAALGLPVDSLRDLDLQGRLTIDRLRATGLVMTEVSVAVRAHEGLLRVAPVTAVLYGGKYSGETTLDVRGKQPALAMKASVDAVQAEPLLKDMMDLDILSGTATIALDVSTRGDTTDALVQELNGSGRFGFRDGAIKGFNAAHLVREAKARLEGKAAPGETARETDFTELAGTFKLTRGVLRNDDLRGSSPFLRLSGNGQADIANQTVDYRVQARIVDTSVGQGAGLEPVKGLDIPVRIRGAWADPSIGLDGNFVSGLLRERLMQELGVSREDIQRRADEVSGEIKREAAEKQQDVQRQLEEKARDAQEKLQDKVQDRLKGLFR